MSDSQTGAHDPFKTMLVWSTVGHVALFAGVALAARASYSGPVLPQPGVAWIVPSGPVPGAGIGGGAPPSPRAKEAPPEVPEPPEPEAAKPRVVRPTTEERDQIPLPDAKPKLSRQRPKQAASGLTGRDSASAPSAKLDSATGVPGLGLGGAGGGGSAFDQDFEYSYYVQQMLGRISLHWQRVPVRGQAVVIIRFTILKDGHLEAVQVEQSSGLAMLDRAAERAVYLSDPMPPLPNSYPRDRVGVHMRFEYSDQQ